MDDKRLMIGKDVEKSGRGLSRYLIGGIEENHEKTSIRNSDHRVKI
jgi:hypothetical protein